MNPELPDELLMERVREGNVDSFEALVRRWEGPILRMTYGLLRDREDALDARQETFIRVFRHSRAYRPSGRFSCWIYTLATHAASDVMRKREKAARPRLVARGEETSSGNPSPEAQQARSERNMLIRKALSRLPERERLVVSMRQFEGLRIREISERLGVPLSTVYARFHSGLARLRNYLGPLMKEELER